MTEWITSFLFAVLFVAAPFASILRIMQRLPKPLALSHRKWPMPLNVALIGIITAEITVFVHTAYYREELDRTAVLMQLMIAGIGYVFALVLLLRQFAGIYPDYVVITGTMGLTIRKIAYRNISNVEQISQSHGETLLRIQTSSESSETFTLPAQHVSTFNNQLRSTINIDRS